MANQMALSCFDQLTVSGVDLPLCSSRTCLHTAFTLISIQSMKVLSSVAWHIYSLCLWSAVAQRDKGRASWDYVSSILTLPCCHPNGAQSPEGGDLGQQIPPGGGGGSSPLQKGLPAGPH